MAIAGVHCLTPKSLYNGCKRYGLSYDDLRAILRWDAGTLQVIAVGEENAAREYLAGVLVAVKDQTKAKKA